VHLRIVKGIVLRMSLSIDQFADEYDQLRSTLPRAGRSQSFSTSTDQSAARVAKERNLEPESILESGSGIGNSTLFFSSFFRTLDWREPMFRNEAWRSRRHASLVYQSACGLKISVYR
jgi:hypothetical protein